MLKNGLKQGSGTVTASLRYREERNHKADSSVKTPLKLSMKRTAV